MWSWSSLNNMTLQSHFPFDSAARASRLYKRGGREPRGHALRTDRSEEATPDRTHSSQRFNCESNMLYLHVLINIVCIYTKLIKPFEQMETMKSARKDDAGEVGRYELNHSKFSVFTLKDVGWLIVSFLWLSCALSDLSEQIKAATKDNHVRAENTQLMLSYQKGQITLVQYKVKCAQ